MKKNIQVILYSIFLSILFLGIASKSSPLYPMNDWLDANAFFTVGKGWMHGLIPYRDLFEQKGPLLYLLYGIGSLCFPHSFFGIFLLEVLAMTINLWMVYRIVKLYHQEQRFPWISILFVMMIVSMKAFFHGGSCEEFTLPFFLMSLYSFLWLLEEERYKNHYPKVYFLNGLLTGIVFWMKYNLLGFWIGFWLVLGLLKIRHQKLQDLCSSFFFYLMGFVLVAIPIILYFGIVGALDDLWQGYFYFNIFLYHAPSMGETTWLEKLGIIYYLLTVNLQKDWLYTIFYGLGIWYIVRYFKKGNPTKWAIVLLFFCFYFFAYLGCVNYPYYFLIMSPFTIFGLLWVSQYLQDYHLEKKVFLPVLLVLAWLFVYAHNQNISFLSYAKESLAQYRFAEIINQYPDSKILYYGGIDAGFYLSSNRLPSERYFQRINVSYDAYPENMDGQIKAIQEKRIDFVILEVENRYVPYLEENYLLLEKQEQYYTEYPRTYALYGLRELVER